MTDSIEKRALLWALGHDTGSSSKAMARILAGEKVRDAAYPSDGGDLGRCLRLLEAIPEWKARLGDVAAASPEWFALISHWDELAALHKKDDGKSVYARMKGILDPIEAKNPNLVKLGNGASIRFGSRR